MMRILGMIWLAVVCCAQVPRVKSWQNAMDGVRTQISITSSSGAIRPAPVLLLECTQPPEKKTPSVGIYLMPGRLEPHPQVGLLNDVSEWLLRVRVDGGKPVSLSWPPGAQTGTYVYEGQGANGMAREVRSPKRFLKDLLAAKEFEVEFQRHGEGKKVAAFDVSGLREALAGRSECGVW